MSRSFWEMARHALESIVMVFAPFNNYFTSICLTRSCGERRSRAEVEWRSRDEVEVETLPSQSFPVQLPVYGITADHGKKIRWQLGVTILANCSLSLITTLSKIDQIISELFFSEGVIQQFLVHRRDFWKTWADSWISDFIYFIFPYLIVFFLPFFFRD